MLQTDVAWGQWRIAQTLDETQQPQRNQAIQMLEEALITMQRLDKAGKLRAHHRQWILAIQANLQALRQSDPVGINVRAEQKHTDRN